MFIVIFFYNNSNSFHYYYRELLFAVIVTKIRITIAYRIVQFSIVTSQPPVQKGRGDGHLQKLLKPFLLRKIRLSHPFVQMKILILIEY